MKHIYVKFNINQELDSQQWIKNHLFIGSIEEGTEILIIENDKDCIRECATVW